jgi:hypothetical protein
MASPQNTNIIVTISLPFNVCIILLVWSNNFDFLINLFDVIGDVRDGVNTIEIRCKGLLDFIENYRKLTRIPKPAFEIVQVKDLFERVGNLMKD